MTLIYSHEHTDAARILDTCFDYKFRQEQNVLTVDGVPLKEGDKIFLVNQSDPQMNGFKEIKNTIDGFLDSVKSRQGIYDVEPAPGGGVFLKPLKPIPMITFKSVINYNGKTFAEIVDELCTPADDAKSWKKMPHSGASCESTQLSVVYTAKKPNWTPAEQEQNVVRLHRDNSCREIYEEYIGARTGRFSACITNKSSLAQTPPLDGYYTADKCDATPTQLTISQQDNLIKYEGYEMPAYRAVSLLPNNHPYKSLPCFDRSDAEKRWIDREFKRFLDTMSKSFRDVYNTHVVYFLEINRDNNTCDYYDTKIKLMKVGINDFFYREFPLDELAGD